MRKIITLLILLPSLAHSAPATFETLMKESKKSRESLKKASPADRKKELNALFKKVQANIAEYKKSTPEEAGPEELKLLRFSYGLEIPQDLKSTDKKSCEQARYQIRVNSLGAAVDTGILPSEDEESLAWVNLLCK